ncbi:MAG: hypothetical protein UR26_C0003G0062 [candidate division TM6 bacterium GW2011_GWF2_32_72]|nr:MAG: hypothetical protein UR26_C0003G0062 [candidate division TM6 bacterium GW2011_GWF2_32_72]
MWRWQQGLLLKLPSRFIFIFRLLCFSIIVHGIFLFSVFFLINGGLFQPTFVITKNLSAGQARIVVLPFYRSVPGALNAKRSGLSKQNIKPIKKSVVKTAFAKLKSAPKEKPIEKKIVKKEPEKIKQKKEEIKKVVKKEEPKKVEEKKVIEPEKKELEKKVEKEEPKIEEPVIEQKEELLVAQETPAVEEGLDVLFVGTDDLQALKLQELIQAEINEAWSPPAGLSKDLECQVKIFVDLNGKSSQIAVVKSSSVLVYDMSAKRAAMSSSFPEALRGKEIVLTFKQG